MACMWNYMGWDNASTFGGEVESPQRSYPRAMLLTVALVAGSYLVAVVAGAATGMPAERWAAGSWVEAAERLGGPALRWLVVAGGVASAAGMFVAILLSWSRLPVALAEDRWLPAAFARRSARTGAPVPALAAGAVMSAMCVGLGLRRLMEIDVLLYGASLVLELVALVVLRVREPELPRPFRIPGGVWGALAVALVPGALLAAAAVVVSRGPSEPAVLGLTSPQLVGAVFAAGVVWYLAARPGRAPGSGRRTPPDLPR
jgi:amino acid transporter